MNDRPWQHQVMRKTVFERNIHSNMVFFQNNDIISLLRCISRTVIALHLSYPIFYLNFLNILSTYSFQNFLQDCDIQYDQFVTFPFSAQPYCSINTHALWHTIGKVQVEMNFPLGRRERRIKSSVQNCGIRAVKCWLRWIFWSENVNEELRAQLNIVK